MIPEPTVLILGAGASIPYGFPSGRWLVIWRYQTSPRQRTVSWPAPILPLRPDQLMCFSFAVECRPSDTCRSSAHRNASTPRCLWFRYRLYLIFSSQAKRRSIASSCLSIAALRVSLGLRAFSFSNLISRRLLAFAAPTQRLP